VILMILWPQCLPIAQCDVGLSWMPIIQMVNFMHPFSCQCTADIDYNLMQSLMIPHQWKINQPFITYAPLKSLARSDKSTALWIYLDRNLLGPSDLFPGNV
jgi:hypothetical protein